MKPQKVRHLREKINTLGYDEKRMKHFFKLALKWLKSERPDSQEKMRRFLRKADWYRRNER